MRDEPKPAVAGPTGEAQRVERDAPRDVRPEYMGKQATSTRGPPSPTPLPFGATMIARRTPATSRSRLGGELTRVRELEWP